jgi:hypothetical protein
MSLQFYDVIENIIGENIHEDTPNQTKIVRIQIFYLIYHVVSLFKKVKTQF